MGCITRVGCLAVVVAAGAGAWWLYGDDLPHQIGKLAGRAKQAVASDVSRAPAAAPKIVWSSLNEATVGGAESVARLGTSKGPPYVTLAAGDLAGFLATALARGLPRSSINPEVALVNDRVLLRAEVNMSDFAGSGAFGSVIGAALKGRDTLRLEGTIDAIRPGLAQYRVRRLEIKGFDVPQRVIPSLVGTMRGPFKADSLAEEGIAIPMPKFVADVRVSNGRITLYRATP